MENLAGSARFLPSLTSGTAADQSTQLIAERAARENFREHVAGLATPDRVLAELELVAETAKRDGAQGSDALARLHEVERRIRTSPIPGGATLMSAVIRVRENVANFWGERAVALESLHETAANFDDVERDARRRVRQGFRTQRTTMNIFTGKAA